MGILLMLLMLTPLMAEHNSTFSFRMDADKEEAYLGEPIRITFTFRYPIDKQIAEANFAPPTFHDFWVKPGRKVPNTIKNGEHIYKLEYLVTPQRPGRLEIEPARMDIGILATKQKNTLRFDRVKWKSIFSNPLHVEVKSLPDDVTLFGDYTISAVVDKNHAKANEPVHLTVTVKGSGNLDEIPDFTIQTDKAAVYSDKPVINTHFEKGLQKGRFIQKFALLSDRNFTIPPFSLTYFDAATKQIKQISTTAIPITVEAPQAVATHPRLEKRSTASTDGSTHSRELWIATLAGAFAAGVLLTLLWCSNQGRFGRSKTAGSLAERIKKAKSDKELLTLLLPYNGRSPQLDHVIEQLESNLYRGQNNRINRKKVAQIVEDLDKITDEEAEILA